jgi:hypothetical protein
MKVSLDFSKWVYIVHKQMNLSHFFIQLNLNFEVYTLWSIFLLIYTSNLDANLPLVYY